LPAVVWQYVHFFPSFVAYAGLAVEIDIMEPLRMASATNTWSNFIDPSLGNRIFIALHRKNVEIELNAITGMRSLGVRQLAAAFLPASLLAGISVVGQFDVVAAGLAHQMAA
jgi:hypothetical protein